MPSTVVAFINYDPVAKVLRIGYRSGLIYEYLEVPEEVYNSMKLARSKGSFLNKHIKNNYEYRKIS